VANECLGNVTQFRYLRTMVTDRNCVCEEINSKLNSGNAYWAAVQNILSPGPLSENIIIRHRKL
jgi:hypothetical protein